MGARCQTSSPGHPTGVAAGCRCSALVLLCTGCSKSSDASLVGSSALPSAVDREDPWWILSWRTVELKSALSAPSCWGGGGGGQCWGCSSEWGWCSPWVTRTGNGTCALVLVQMLRSAGVGFKCPGDTKKGTWAVA